jgi:uncharacterized protein (TIRG00374 family)
LRLQRLAFAAGLGLFLWLLHRIGLGLVWRNLVRVGWGFAAILALEAVVLVLHTLAWRRTLPPGSPVPLGSLLAMRLAGDAVNAIAPAAVVGGELARAGLLARWVRGTEALSSVGLAALTQFLAQVLFVGAGATLARAGGLQPRLRVFGLLLLACLLAFVGLLWRLSRRRGESSSWSGRLLDRAGRILQKRIRREDFWQSLNQQVFGAMRDRPSDLVLSVLLFLSGWLAAPVEVGLVLFFLGTPVPAGTAFSISVLIVLVEGCFFFVPARFGVQEGGLYAIFLALGLNPASGFSLGVVRRLRELLWGLAGLAVLGLYRRRSAGNAGIGADPWNASTLVRPSGRP